MAFDRIVWETGTMMTGLVLFVVIAIMAALVLGSRDKLSAILGASNGSENRKPAPRASHAESDWGVMPAPLRPAKPRWLGYEEVLQVKGMEIAHPMTYVSSGNGIARDPSEIGRSLPIARVLEADALSCWPWYARMNPAQRYIYLEWLSSDRAKLPPGDGYLFVYYYGLERRALAPSVAETAS